MSTTNKITVFFLLLIASYASVIIYEKSMESIALGGVFFFIWIWSLLSITKSISGIPNSIENYGKGTYFLVEGPATYCKDNPEEMIVPLRVVKIKQVGGDEDKPEFKIKKRSSEIQMINVGPEFMGEIGEVFALTIRKNGSSKKTHDLECLISVLNPYTEEEIPGSTA